MALSPKRAAFVIEYCVDWNGTQAAIRAGYSKKTAYSIAYENLRIPEIAEAIEKRATLYAVGKEERLQLLGEIARDKEAETTSDRIRAIENLGKIAGDYTEHKKLEHSGEIDQRIKFIDYGLDDDDDDAD